MKKQKAQKIMEAIGFVSDEMLIEAEEYSQYIRKSNLRKKKLKRMAKDTLSIGVAVAIICIVFSEYSSLKQKILNMNEEVAKEENNDKHLSKGTQEKEGVLQKIHIFNPEISESDVALIDGIESKISQDIANDTNSGIEGEYKYRLKKRTDKNKEDVGEAVEIEENKKQKLNLLLTESGARKKIQFIFQFGKVTDIGEYTIRVNTVGTDKTTIDKIESAEKKQQYKWRENKKDKVQCKPGTKIMFSVELSKSGELKENERLTEVKVEYTNDNDKASEVQEKKNIVIKRTDKKYVLCLENAEK